MRKDSDRLAACPMVSEDSWADVPENVDLLKATVIGEADSWDTNPSWSLTTAEIDPLDVMF